MKTQLPQNILILGLGKSGMAAARFLSRRGHTLFGADRENKLAALKTDLPIQLFSERDLDLTKKCDLLVVSPGIPLSNPLYEKARRENLKVLGEMELAARFISQFSVGITGTKGKTTLVALIAHLLKSIELPAKPLGNIGIPLTEYLLNPNPRDLLIIEASSFQLETLQTPLFDISAWIDFSLDHLDHHGTMLEYALAKRKIFEALKPGGEGYLFKKIAQSLPDLFPFSHFSYDLDFFSTKEEIEIKKYLTDNPFLAIRFEEMLLAFRICSRFGLTKNLFLDALSSFQKPAHRLEFVKKIKEVSYINDSKSTNITSTLYAMQWAPSPFVLIAGGRHKGGSFKEWGGLLKEKGRKIIGLGEMAPLIERDLKGEFPCETAISLEEAVKSAAAIAKEGDIVLFSPGGSSFDAFENFEQRGDLFKKCVHALD